MDPQQKSGSTTCNFVIVVLLNFEADPLMPKGQKIHLKISLIPVVPSYLQLLLQDYQDYGVPQTVPKPRNSSSPSKPVQSYNEVEIIS